MGGAAFDSPLRVLATQEAIYQARSKGIASSNAIEDFKVFPILCLIKLSFAIADRAPIVLGGGFCFSQGGRNQVERVIFHDLADHLLETIHFKR